MIKFETGLWEIHDITDLMINKREGNNWWIKDWVSVWFEQEGNMGRTVEGELKLTVYILGNIDCKPTYISYFEHPCIEWED